MPDNFDLVITADTPSLTAELRLLDGHGSQLAYYPADFKPISASNRQGLFDLRNFLRNYVEPGNEQASVAAIGVCIAEDILGQEIFSKLWASEAQRTLRIQLPAATGEENRLAAALARVPWEIARPSANQPNLGDRNLLVRIVHDMAAPSTEPLPLGPDECLRVLFVFAEARRSRPLAARREWRELLRLFEQEIYPNRRIIAHPLSHGVTRERLKAQIEENGGYHIVHWSGHGHVNRLELTKPGGAADSLSGEELLDLFTQAGGFIPRLFFLSACHSGDILRVKDWTEFLAVAEGKEPGAKDAAPPETRDIQLEQEPGYTGTAHALLAGGVPSVVAMRYAVGDDYARELGVEFYRALLAHGQPKTVAVALTMARRALGDPQKHEQARFAICDHATPVLYGAEQLGLILPRGRSPGLDTRDPRLHRIVELTTAGHQHFVGRRWELAGLGADFIGASHSTEVKPVAVIMGLGGMGKTALTAEVLALWEQRFQWVLLYQAKPNALNFDTTLRDIHLKLNGELGRYHNHVQLHPADAIFRDPGTEFTGQDRLERLTLGGQGDAKEIAYLNDALATSNDQLIAGASPDARRLLWVIAMANDPVALGLLRGVWSGKSLEQEQLENLKAMLDNLAHLPPEVQEHLMAMPPELRARLEALQPAATRPDPTPFLRYLVSVGLVTEERNLTCHELVRERIRGWMCDHPEDRAGLTENMIRLAYAERLEAFFDSVQHKDMTTALEAGRRALVYYAEAQAYDRLGAFASGVVTSASDPVLLEAVRPHLEAAAESAPEGEARRDCLFLLAGALSNAGRPDASLSYYERAAALARTAAEAGGEGSRQAWSDLSAIAHNWGIALNDTGNLDAARERYLESVAAKEKAGSPTVNVIGSQLEALRIDIKQGHAARALPQVKEILRRWRTGGGGTAPARACRRRRSRRTSPARSSAPSILPMMSTVPKKTGMPL
jgi:tetratricopeptide (TPR) repeat protein